MEIDAITIFIVFASLLTLIAFSIYFIRHNVEEAQESRIFEEYLAKGELDKIFAEIDFIINQEFTFLLQIPFEGKDVKKITNFEETLQSLNNAVIDALNNNMVERLEYVGIKQEYLYSYITRKNMTLLMVYISDNNINTNKDEEEE